MSKREGRVWRVRQGRSALAFPTKSEALDYARRRAKASGRAQVVIPPAAHGRSRAVAKR